MAAHATTANISGNDTRPLDASTCAEVEDAGQQQRSVAEVTACGGRPVTRSTTALTGVR
jgi:hypothetical protein